MSTGEFAESSHARANPFFRPQACHPSSALHLESHVACPMTTRFKTMIAFRVSPNPTDPASAVRATARTTCGGSTSRRCTPSELLLDNNPLVLNFDSEPDRSLAQGNDDYVHEREHADDHVAFLDFTWAAGMPEDSFCSVDL